MSWHIFQRKPYKIKATNYCQNLNCFQKLQEYSKIISVITYTLLAEHFIQIYMARSSGIPQQLRGYDSWIDIPSQTSSQSQSPVNSEIVTTGLRIQQSSSSRRRRRAASNLPPSNTVTRGKSNQEEYEESESDEDHILTSSDEHLDKNPLISLSSCELDSDLDRNKSGKCIPRKAESTKILSDPQLDAKQIPLDQYPDDTDGFLSSSSTNMLPSYSPRNMFHQNSLRCPTDHDAALRASLTTLLSIGAAAARGLPNRETNLRRNIMLRNQENNDPIGLRFVSESELMSPTQPQISPPSTNSLNDNHQHTVFLDKNKRAMTPLERVKTSRKTQLSPKENTFPPTFLTWAVSAGVLVIIGVIGFGVGYVIGREVGRQETLTGLRSSALRNSSIYGRETMKSSSGALHRFKLNAGGVSRHVIS